MLRMAFMTYENWPNRYVSIHRDDCTQLRKHGGVSRSGKRDYVRHETFAEASAHAVKTGLPIKICSFCDPKSATLKSK